jgi:DNA adenine methylase
MKIHLKTPVSYYGGKQNLLSTILPLIPEHNLYCEPFCGGAAVFWGKEPSKVEIINDLNTEVINFYKVLKNDFENLWQRVDATLHSRRSHVDAEVMYKHPHLFTDLDRAWAFWVQTNQSFSSNICAGWAYARQSNSCEKKVNYAKERFKEVYKERLKHVQIECKNALSVIKSRDADFSFFYIDPPYPEASQGHYAGYRLEDFIELLNLLKTLKGKFLLSSYDYPILAQFALENGWHQFKKEMTISANKGTRDKKKVEVFTANYPL